MTKKKKKHQPDADSTIGMSAYNLMAIKGRPADLDEILQELKQIQHPGLTKTQLRKAIMKLIKKEYAIQIDQHFSIKDIRPRKVVSRDRSDAVISEKTGNVLGGWNGWMVENGDGMVPIDEVIK